MKKQMINYDDLIEYRYGPDQARRLIRLAKLRLVKEGYALYNNKRVGLVPYRVVCTIINSELTELVNYSDLRSIRYPKSQARKIVNEAKEKLVDRGYYFYNNRRVALVPTHVVAEIIGVLPVREEDQ